MNKHKLFLKKLTANFMALSMAAYSLSGVAMAQTIDIVGNGSNSDNEVEIEHELDATVVQNNTAYIRNNINVDVETGENDANDNTGGDVTILTGNGHATLDLRTMVNLNQAVLDLDSPQTNLDILISGNGSDSDNEVEVEKEIDAEIFQDNRAHVRNDVDVDVETGENDANRNTGGDVAIITGHGTADIDVRNLANANIAYVGDNGGPLSIDAEISGNGSNSDNEIELEKEIDLLLTQDNRAHLRNEIDVDAETGENDANDNTGGDVLIDTGNATTSLDVRNHANLNLALVDFGAWLGDDLKIGGNGSNSDNEIELEVEKDLEVFQGCNDQPSNSYSLFRDHEEHRYPRPCLYVDNDIDVDAETGENDVERNTTEPNGDPAIITGHSTSHTDVHTAGNANIFSTDGTLELPGGWELDFDFDLSGLMHWMMAS